MKTKKLPIILALIILLLLIVGVVLSQQNGTDSIRLTDQLLINANVLTANEVENKTGNYAAYSFMIREIGHFALFSIAGCLIFILLYSITGRIGFSLLGTLIIVIAYAFFDESRQRNVSGRTFDYMDIKLDIVGGSIGMLLAAIGVAVGRWRVVQNDLVTIKTKGN